MNSENKQAQNQRLLSTTADPDKLKTNEFGLIQFGTDRQMVTVCFLD